MRGKGALLLTRSLGDVMNESAHAAMSFVRANLARWKLEPKAVADQDFHIHVPAGAVQKDGPSAGLAMTVALYSLVTGRPVPADVAMTGEITLRGKIMPVGGIKEKILAASRAGIKRVLLPAGNKKNLEEIPPEVLKKMKLTFVQNADDALGYLAGSDGHKIRRLREAASDGVDQVEIIGVESVGYGEIDFHERAEPRTLGWALSR